MSDQDDERWITERDNEPGASFRTCMRAALARGYERGLSEGAAERDELRAWRCDVTVALERPQGTFYADVPKLIRDVVADRYRLAKRCEELEGGATRCHRNGCSRPAVACVACVQDVADDAGERADAEINAETINRLAALESRVGALVDAECDLATGAIHYGTYKDRLAALRSPVAQVERDAVLDGLRAQLADLTRERDVYRIGDERARKAVRELSEERATALRDLATAIRERDEARAVLRDLVAWKIPSPVYTPEPDCWVRARAIVRGER